MKYSILVLGLVAAVARCVHAAQYYVAPGGSDSSAGSLTNPFRTIQRAADIVGPGDICFVRGGTYRETVELDTSGTHSNPIRFAAYPGEVVTLSGTEKLDADWHVHTGCVYKTKVPRYFDQLFVDGKMMIEARWPNMRREELWNRSNWARAAKGSRYGSMKDPELARTGVDWTGALATLNVTHQFYTWTRPVTRHGAGRDVFEYPKDFGKTIEMRFAEKTKVWEDDRYYLSGKLEALDTPTEWFLDAKSRTLYLWTEDGANPESKHIEFKTRDYAFKADNVDYVEMSGFHFFGSTFLFEKCNHCTVDNCHLMYPAYARELTELSRNPSSTVRTAMSGDYNSVINSSLAFTPIQGLSMTGRQNTVENSLVHDVCWNGSLKYTAIQMNDDRTSDAPPGCRVRRNTTFNCGNAIIGYRSQPYVIELNHVYAGGLACRDVALVYTGQPTCAGSIVRRNWVHGCRTEDGKGLGIRGDDQTRGLTVHHNVVWDCGRDGIIVKGDNNRVYNNTVMSIGSKEKPGNFIVLPVRTEPTKPWRHQHPLLDRQNVHSEIYNNAARTVAGDQVRGTPFPWARNLANNFMDEDPMLAEPAQWDFEPGPGSPLIDAGREIPGFTDGYKGTAPDIGAYEHGGEHWIPGCTNGLWISAPYGRKAGTLTVRVALRMPPLESVRLKVRRDRTETQLQFTAEDWMVPQTVSLPVGVGPVEFSDRHLGHALVADITKGNARLGCTVSFDRPMLPTRSPSLTMFTRA